jgi:hypothetical protein
MEMSQRSGVPIVVACKADLIDDNNGYFRDMGYLVEGSISMAKGGGGVGGTHRWDHADTADGYCEQSALCYLSSFVTIHVYSTVRYRIS